MLYWHAPTNRNPFEDHKLLHDRRRVCGGNGDRFNLAYRFSTDVLTFSFHGVPASSDEFYASFKAALIEASTSVVKAESGVTLDGNVHRDLILYDNVPGGTGYVRKVAQAVGIVLSTARQMLDGCQCEKSCYKCLRSYENQFEHSLLDKTLVQPYLDRLIARTALSAQS